jgi:hypothetical protein
MILFARSASLNPDALDTGGGASFTAPGVLAILERSAVAPAALGCALVPAGGADRFDGSASVDSAAREGKGSSVAATARAADAAKAAKGRDRIFRASAQVSCAANQ